jgi:putative ABC transport system permease protein
VFQITVAGSPLTFQLIEQRASFPGIDDRRSFAVVPFNWVLAALGTARPPSVLWLRGTADAAGPLAATVADVGSARLVSRYDAYAALRDPPLVAAIPTGYEIALIVATGFMTLAIIGALVLSAARRTRDLAFLRTLGLTARQALWLTILEQIPMVVLALIPGVLLGIAVAGLVEPGLALSRFTGDSEAVLFVDWPALAMITAALVGVVVVAVAVGTWLAHRVPVADALRVGHD